MSYYFILHYNKKNISEKVNNNITMKMFTNRAYCVQQN